VNEKTNDRQECEKIRNHLTESQHKQISVLDGEKDQTGEKIRSRTKDDRIGLGADFAIFVEVSHFLDGMTGGEGHPEE